MVSSGLQEHGTPNFRAAEPRERRVFYTYVQYIEAAQLRRLSVPTASACGVMFDFAYICILLRNAYTYKRTSLSTMHANLVIDERILYEPDG